MANRFPLIVNAVDAKIYELASGDNLDLTGSGIYNGTATLTLPTATGTLATLAGTETLTNKTYSSGTLSGTFAGSHTLSGVVTVSNATAASSTSTGAVVIGGGLGVAGSIYADKIYAVSNGSGANVYIGDDTILGDINQSNTLAIRGQQDSTKGYIVFGSSNATAYLGRDGTNPITAYGGQFAISGTATGGSAIMLQLTGYTNKGGVGYHDFLSVTNTYASATNPNKYLRLNSTGDLEIVNSAYGTTILSLTDAGTLTVPALTATGYSNFSGTSSVKIPVGTTVQRGTAATGQIRFNSDLTSFEGYNGTAWSSLGGVKSVDGYTYIIAETSSGASNGELEFYAETSAGTAATKVGGWNYTRLLSNTPIDFTGSTSGTTRVQATAAASGTLTLPAATDTLVGKATTDTLTNKTINLSSNTLTATSAQIAAAVSDETGSGSLVFGTSPSFTTSVLTGSTTFNVFNTTATTINAFGAATTLSLGAGTGTTTVNNNMVVTGNLTVNGTTTTINSTTMQVDDITVELGTVATPTDVTANGGGIILKGATDKSITWSTTGWTSSEDFNLVTGKAYEINGTSVLNATTLGSGVTASSLTSVGTITTGVWNAGAVTSSGGVQGTTLTSTVATGTAPLTVTSTTKVANLNVEQVDGYHADTANTASTLVTRDASKFIYTSDHIFSGSTSGTTTLKASAAAGATTITMPAVTGTMVTTGDTGTVTNTMLAGSIANAKLANSTISGVALGSNLATLTLGVSGTGLSGSTTYNGSGAATFTVTSNATSANTVSTIVARDASGNFSAGTITAALSGNASTATTATNQSGGTVAATTGSFSGQITSTVANGTAPMVVSSTTKVTNLNVELVDGYHADTANTASTIAVRDASSKITASGQVATGGMFEHSATISANYAVASGNNAISAGPVSVASGITVTIPSGSVWTIV